jgi:hypothetical protein
MRARRLVTIAAVALALPAGACINTFDSRIRELQAKGDPAGVAEIVAKLEKDFQADGSLEHGNDLAVGKLLTGHTSEAVKLLRGIERRFPEKAIVAANLGTAYELAGDDRKALTWIREGVRRDPDEHEGSEWLHVRILEAKIEISQDPHWLDSHTVLGVDFGNGELPKAEGALPPDATGTPRKPAAVALAIDYQLAERTKFVKPPDAVIADLYAAQADLAFEWSLSKKSASTIFMDPWTPYENSLKYGAMHSSVVRRRVDALNRLTGGKFANVSAATVENPYSLADGYVELLPNWIIGASLLAGIGGGWFFYGRRRFRKP